jgi:hypothetical protein
MASRSESSGAKDMQQRLLHLNAPPLHFMQRLATIISLIGMNCEHDQAVFATMKQNKMFY